MGSSSTVGVGATARTKRLRVILNTVERQAARGAPVPRLVETIMFNMGLQRPRAQEHVDFLVELHKLVRVGDVVYAPAFAPGGLPVAEAVPAPAADSMELEAGSDLHRHDGDDGPHDEEHEADRPHDRGKS